MTMPQLQFTALQNEIAEYGRRFKSVPPWAVRCRDHAWLHEKLQQALKTGVPVKEFEEPETPTLEGGSFDP